MYVCMYVCMCVFMYVCICVCLFGGVGVDFFYAFFDRSVPPRPRSYDTRLPSVSSHVRVSAV